MVTPYTPPDVYVTQKSRQASAPRVQPALPVVLVGPARQIEVEGVAGVYTAGTEFEAPLPNLMPGAVVDPTTAEVMLDAQDSSGKSLGLFRLALDTPADAALVSNNSRVRVFASMGLEYSLINAVNNDLSTANDQVSAATPNGISMVDATLDFLSRGAAVGDSFVNVTAPAAAIGRYGITELVQSGGAVHEVLLQKMAAGTTTPELSASFTIKADAGGAPLTNNAFVWGFGTGHVQGSVAFGSKTNQTTATYSVTQGVGIEAIVMSTVLADWTDICQPGAITMPDATSSASVWFQPALAGASGTNFGRDNATWKALMAAAQLGHWLRFVGDFDGVPSTGTAQIRDYKIVGLDRVNSRLLLQNPDGLSGASGTVAVTEDDLTGVYLLKVFKGYDDAANSAGDFTVGATGSNIPFKNEIRRATPYLIEYREPLPALGTTTTLCTLQRGLPVRGATISYDLTKRLTDGFTGNVLVSYEASRVDLSVNGLIDIASEKEIEDKLGLIDPGNPLAFGAALVNAGGINAGGTIFYALATDGDGVDAFAAALTTLEAVQTAYYIVPLSMNPAVLDMFINHVEVQSQPINKHERRCFISRTLDLVDPVWPLNAGQVVPQGTVDVVDRTKFVSTQIDWSLVTAGDMLHILSAADITGTPVASLRIQSINQANNYAKTFEAWSTVLTGDQYFKVETYPRSKQEQAELWRDQAAAIGKQRVVTVLPDQVEVAYTNKRTGVSVSTTALVPAMYACAAFVGFRGAQAPQQPVTNMQVPGLLRLVHSAGYFTPAQLDTIASGGNLILTQTSALAPVTVRHQLTTDRSTVQTGELSYGIIADYVAITLREGLRPYIGKHNITREYLIQLRHILEQLLTGLKNDGVLLDGTSIETFMQDPDHPDEILVEIGCDIPLPLNRINITLYI